MAYAVQGRLTEAAAPAVGMVAGSLAGAAVEGAVKAVAVASVRPVIGVSTRASVAASRNRYVYATRYQRAAVGGLVGFGGEKGAKAIFSQNKSTQAPRSAAPRSSAISGRMMRRAY